MNYSMIMILFVVWGDRLPKGDRLSYIPIQGLALSKKPEEEQGPSSARLLDKYHDTSREVDTTRACPFLGRVRAAWALLEESGRGGED